MATQEFKPDPKVKSKRSRGKVKDEPVADAAVEQDAADEAVDGSVPVPVPVEATAKPGGDEGQSKETRAAALHRQGKHVAEIARTIGLSQAKTRAAIEAAGYTPIEPPKAASVREDIAGVQAAIDGKKAAKAKAPRAKKEKTPEQVAAAAAEAEAKAKAKAESQASMAERDAAIVKTFGRAGTIPGVARTMGLKVGQVWGVVRRDVSFEPLTDAQKAAVVAFEEATGLSFQQAAHALRREYGGESE